MPRAAAAALAEYAETCATRGVRDRVFEAVDEIRATGAWRCWQGPPPLVT
jgi:hypothetical protein